MVKIGQKIRVRADYLEAHRQYVYKTYTIVGIYPHLVLTVDEYGIRRCFNIGDLVMYGLCMQDVKTRKVIIG